MNFYQQNNNLSVLAQIQIDFLNITFVNIVNDSNLHNLISRLVVAQKEFQKCFDYKVSGAELKSKAIEMSSILESLMDSIKEVPYEKQFQFADKVIKSSAAIINQYKEALSIEGFNEGIIEDLKKYTQKFYQDNFGKDLDSFFWFRIKCYEWFLKERFVERKSFPVIGPYEHSFIFDEDTLEEFFSSNRKEVLNYMLNCVNDNRKLSIPNPLNESRIHNSYSLYVQISSLTSNS